MKKRKSTKKRTTICEICSIELSLSNVKIHTGSKQCLQNKKFGIKSKEKAYIDPNLVCRFCETKLANDNSFRNHERLCSENPNRQLSYFVTNQDDVIEIKKNSEYLNQFSKATKLGLPKPEVSERQRAAAREIIMRVPGLTHSSKEADRFIERLMTEIPELSDCRLYYARNPHEYVLNKDGKKYCYDFTIKDLNLIVEYNGTKFHPKSENDPEFAPIFESQDAVNEIWERDQFKINLAKENGFDVMIVWSDDVETGLMEIRTEILKRIFIQSV
jgi:very-short-patch-repair endonuclease